MERIKQLRTDLGGSTVFLKIPLGQKGPKSKGWQETTLCDMTDEYLSDLESGNYNIGILLGQKSGGLCSVDIDRDAEIEEFLDLNPALRETFRTRGSRGANIWVRIIGDHPRLTKLCDIEGNPWGEFRADGGQTVVAGKHPSGCEYAIVIDKPVVEIVFEDIHWPEHLVLPWARHPEPVAPAEDPLAELYAQQGEPFLVNDKGGVSINQGCLAELFCLENLVLYEPSENDFYLYNGENGLWERQTPTRIARAVETMVRQLMIECELKHAVGKITASLIDSIIKLIRPKVENADAFGCPKNILHVLNGVIDLEEDPMVLKSFSPDFYSRNQIPVEYEEGARCPRFVNDLLSACLNEEDVDLVQRILGSFLLPTNAAQSVILVTGAAGSGKSTFVSVVERIIGEDNVYELRTQNLNGRFESQFYVGMRLLTGKDVPGKFLQEAGAHTIKKLCGNDSFSVERKGSSEAISLRGNFHILIASNCDLHVALDGDSEAWRRRLVILEWNKPPANRQRIPGFDELLLREEGSGILNWMLSGLQRHRQELVSAGKFILSEAQAKRVDDLLNESDSVRAFAAERLIPFQGRSVTARALIEAYENYCAAQGWEPHRSSRVNQELRSTLLETYGIRQSHDLIVDGTFRRGYRNLTLRD
ncbi:MAG: phage/plasmid primase, P4 family [Verrucomicrobiota bacterium JB024]|nr:phage/plasmid primase, P4 family [Verrucomicrobiota bacterium JB024]